MNKPELIFSICGSYYWAEICDTIKRISAEFGESHTLRINVESVLCYADNPINKSQLLASALESSQTAH